MTAEETVRTGPWHYRRAERLLAAAESHDIPWHDDAATANVLALRAEYHREAQVHATLALTAATAAGTDAREWRQPGAPLDPHLTREPR